MAYITKEELVCTKIGFDFRQFDEGDFLDDLITLGTGVIDDYLGRTYQEGTYNEKGETIVDKQGRIIIRTKNKPIGEVTSLKAQVTGSEDITLEVQNLEIFNDAGYMYFHTSVALGVSDNSYPSVALSAENIITYKITYTVAANGVPEAVKRALAYICAHLLKDQELYNQTGMSSGLGVKSFSSGAYSVNFADNKKTSGEGSYSADALIPPIAKALLARHRNHGQNIF